MADGDVSLWADPAAMAQVNAAVDNINSLSANIGNYKNTKATNKANKEINEAQIALQRELYQESQKYNSPVEQRRMLEAAGYAPSSFLDSVHAQPVSGVAPSVVPMQQPYPIQTPNVLHQTELALQAEMQKKLLLEKDVDIARKEFDLGVDKDSVVDELNKRYGESRAAVINAERLAVLRDIDKIQLAVDEQFKIKISEESLRQLKESVNLLVEQADSERARQRVDDSLSALYRGRNKRESVLLQPTINEIKARIDELGARAREEGKRADILGWQEPAYKNFFYSIMESQMTQGFRAEDVATQMEKKLRGEIQLLDKENDYYEINVLRNLATDWSQIRVDASKINNLKITQRQKDKLIQERIREFDRRMSDEERDVFMRYFDADGNVTGASVRYTKERKY